MTEATTYTPAINGDDITIKTQVSQILIEAGISVPDDHMWVISDNAEDMTKVMVNPLDKFYNNAEVRHLSGMFVDLQRKKILALGNKPKESQAATLQMSSLKEEVEDGTAVIYPRMEVVQIRLIRALDNNDQPKIYYLGNRFIDARGCTWSKSATFGQMLSKYTNKFDFESLFADEKQHNLQYDMILVHPSLHNVGQCPPSQYTSGVTMQRIRMAGSHAPSGYSNELGDIVPANFRKPTVFTEEQADDFLRYGWYSQDKEEIEKLRRDEQPGEGVYVDIFGPDGSFRKSLVISHPSFEFRRNNMTIVDRSTRISSDAEKLWYFRLDVCPIFARQNRDQAIQEWIRASAFFGSRGTRTHTFTEQTIMWREGGLTRLSGKRLDSMHAHLQGLAETKNYAEIFKVYQEQIWYRLLMSVSIVRRNEILDITHIYNNDKKLLSLWLAGMRSPIDVNSLNYNFEGLYRLNKAEKNSVRMALESIVKKLESTRDANRRQARVKEMLDEQFGRILHLLIITYRAVKYNHA